MIFCETGGVDADAWDSLLAFVSQARACGLSAVISSKSLPPDLRASHQFDAAPFITDLSVGPTDTIVLIEAQKLDVTRATRLRELCQGAEVPCIAFGNFASRQSEITIASRIAYALNVTPRLINMVPHPLFGALQAPVFGAPLGSAGRARPVVGLFAPDLSDPEVRGGIRLLAMSRKFDIALLTTGADKKKWIDQEGYTIPAWHPGELMPRALAAQFDLAVMFSPPSGWARWQMVVANLCCHGVPIIDSTPRQAWGSQSSDIIMGPVRSGDLMGWLEQTVLPQGKALGSATRTSDLAKGLGLPDALASLRAKPPKMSHVTADHHKPVLFVPTNGVGLGHAKRCSLIADAMRDQRPIRFAAFPSCIGMLTNSGFDTVPLVNRASHRAPHENDLVNFARISPLARKAAAVVFDGGYVFDSIMRSAADNGRPAIWIRRGLWQASQNNQVAHDRQKIFSKVIVPTEAFDELNGPPEQRDNVHRVGPIVQDCALDPSTSVKLRNGLAAQCDIKGKKLVLTMLGGGVAADRSAQINAICAHLEHRSDVMHLLVVWPTATTDPAWFQYRNTRVVQSIHASVLIPMADLFISAIGYNSFHEAIYGKVPTIFIPQMASFMDDQRARGRAAAEREIAILIEPWEMLSLTRAIEECLADRGALLRENLRKMNLPETGAKRAAQHIVECL